MLFSGGHTWIKIFETLSSPNLWCSCGNKKAKTKIWEIQIKNQRMNILSNSFYPNRLGLEIISTTSLQRGKTPPQWVSSIWHSIIWWWGSSNAGALGNAEHPFISITPGPISFLGVLLWHLWLSHPPRARVNTCTQCVYLTNPCTKRKVLSLTKPKSKIYKTKSIRNYIT